MAALLDVLVIIVMVIVVVMMVLVILKSKVFSQVIMDVFIEIMVQVAVESIVEFIVLVERTEWEHLKFLFIEACLFKGNYINAGVRVNIFVEDGVLWVNVQRVA